MKIWFMWSWDCWLWGVHKYTYATDIDLGPLTVIVEFKEAR